MQYAINQYAASCQETCMAKKFNVLFFLNSEKMLDYSTPFTKNFIRFTS